MAAIIAGLRSSENTDEDDITEVDGESIMSPTLAETSLKDLDQDDRVSKSRDWVIYSVTSLREAIS